ncbi:hypothetical protein FQN54_006820 [Arachnomyces sp. PD_36]|nr:hypothetical protein FQN54_006820 [Arachnomyces sp. PD_36]
MNYFGHTSSALPNNKISNPSHTSLYTNPQNRGQPQQGIPYPGQRVETFPQDVPDSRSTVPCKFLSLPGGCQINFCPYLHVINGQEVKSSRDEDIEMIDVGELEQDQGLTRELSGASVYYGESGNVLKVSLPTDFSLAHIRGLVPGSTAGDIVHKLQDIGFKVDVDCVQIRSPTSARVKVEDPSFAAELSTRLRKQGPFVSAVPIPINAGKTDSRQVCVFWNKPSRNAWLDFDSGELANRVALSFHQGLYTILGQAVRSTGARIRPVADPGLKNPVRWTIMLSDVPHAATSDHIKQAIRSPYDEPQRIVLGDVSYAASDREVSAEIRSRLEEHGPVDNFNFSPTPNGRRVKVTAWYQDEIDARSACSMNNEPLGILGGGKLTVSQIQVTEIKVPNPIYSAVKRMIENESVVWEDKHVAFYAHPHTEEGITTLTVEGTSAEDVVNARKALEDILDGTILTGREGAIWSPALHKNEVIRRKLRLIEKSLGVAIITDISKRQLRLCGSLKKRRQVADYIANMLRKEPSTTYEIELKPHQFSWAAGGGFKDIQQALGDDVAIFNVQAKKITINGTQRDYLEALAIMDRATRVGAHGLPEDPNKPKEICPICFCEADNPIQTSCKHTYCLECFEGFCKSAPTNSKKGFQIKCQGDEGACSTVFTLPELKEHLSSALFEGVLKLSFQEYIKHHPGDFHYCPTPDCGNIYRCTNTPDPKPPPYTCPNCLKPVCTSCHEHHGAYSCADHKDNISGRAAVTMELRKKFDIKDCPKCTTSIQKAGGCDSMTCQGCKAYICWLCLAVFEERGPCYSHISKSHSNIGRRGIGRGQGGPGPIGEGAMGLGAIGQGAIGNRDILRGHVWPGAIGQGAMGLWEIGQGAIGNRDILRGNVWPWTIGQGATENQETARGEMGRGQTGNGETGDGLFNFNNLFNRQEEEL